MENKGCVENIKLKGEIHLILKDKNGKVKDERHLKNTITNTGKAALAGLLLADVSETAFDWIGLGTGTTAAAATDTALETEITSGGGERAASAGSNVGATLQIARFLKTFTFTDRFDVTEMGLFNASSGGTMADRQVFTALNIFSSDTLATRIDITIS